MAKIGAIILAAGLSSRMGRFKLLLPLSDGKPILQHVVATLTPVNVMPIMVVTGNRADDVQTALAGKPVQFAYNPHYAQGELLSSLQVGLRHMPTDVDAALVMLGDMPFISVATIRQIIHNYAPSSIVVPFYDGQKGHPVMFPRLYWDAIDALPHGETPRTVLKQHADSVQRIDVADEGVLLDIDTPSDLEE